MVNDLHLSSSYSRQMLYDSTMMHTGREISENYESLKEFYLKFVGSGKFTHTLMVVQKLLSSLRDIRNTISRLESGYILDDIELYEIKNLVIINEEISRIFRETTLRLKHLDFKSLQDIASLLDPERTGINSFYIYDIYSVELGKIRQEIRKSGYSDELYYKASLIEEDIRKDICNKIKQKEAELFFTLQNLAGLDILIAKSEQLQRLNLSFPSVCKGKSTYKSLFNPEIKELLIKEGKSYQEIDIEFTPGVSLLLTGANMGGKSVTLRTLGLSQYLFQFGFGIPAGSACITPVSDVLISVDDGQDIYRGLSSFAAEMEMLNRVIIDVRSGKKLLVLIDEPARTTNPYEGTALVKALVTILNDSQAGIIVTTHYNISNVTCKRLRVKGFENGRMNYAYIEVDSEKVPHEAISIARSLGVDKEWLEMAEKMIDN
jgi:dsDNA-specific endonuclease/ATPase MutS2